MVDTRKLAPLVANAPENNPHKHAGLIKLWADGFEIEYLSATNKWEPMFSNMGWYNFIDYRLKPTKPKDKHMEALIVLSPHAGPLLYAAAPDEANCVLVFDGTTNKLIKAEVKSPAEAIKRFSEVLDNHSQWQSSWNAFKRTGEL